MFKPCPNCGFLVALIRGREASQRCPRCGSALVDTADAASDAPTSRAQADDALDGMSRTGHTAGHPTREDAAHGDSTTIRPEADAREASPAQTTRVEDVREPPEGAAGVKAADTRTDSGTAGIVDAAALELPSASRQADAPPDPRPVDAPAFVRRRALRGGERGRRWPAVAATVALALLLAVQLLLAQRHELARDARWRPVVAAACSMLGCALPPWREPTAFAMLARGVRPHPQRPGVLRVTTTVRNDAQWPQPLPVVVLQLSDIDGRIVGGRAVPPRDYAGAADALVAPRASVDIAFEVREPAGRVVSFDFQLK